MCYHCFRGKRPTLCPWFCSWLVVVCFGTPILVQVDFSNDYRCKTKLQEGTVCFPRTHVHILARVCKWQKCVLFTQWVTDRYFGAFVRDHLGRAKAGGYPTSGTPPVLTWLGGYPTSGISPPSPIGPGWGTPCPDLGGVPHPCLGGCPTSGTPHQTWLGYPSPRLDLAGLHPPPPQVWTDWKHYLPHPSDAVGKNNLCETSAFIYTRSSRWTWADWKLKPCLHVTAALAFTSIVKNSFYGNKWLCSHLRFNYQERDYKDKRKKKGRYYV